MISRKYKFHVLERKTADFFEPSEILFSQNQCKESQLFYLGNVSLDDLLGP